MEYGDQLLFLILVNKKDLKGVEIPEDLGIF
jgi:hypothetical protein